MLQFIATNAVISRGFDNKAALKFSDDGNIVRFRIGERVYDKNAENNTRWINLNVKAFGNLCERIKKMQLKEGSFVNLIGRFDEDVWTDRETGEVRSQPLPQICLPSTVRSPRPSTHSRARRSPSPPPTETGRSLRSALRLSRRSMLYAAA